MERLRAHDLRAVLAALQELATADTLQGFPELALAAIGQLVPADSRAYNEIDSRRRRALAVYQPAEAMFPEAEQILAEHAGEHPLIRQTERHTDSPPLRLSDFISTRELHRLDLYQLLFRRLGVEYQIAFALATPPLVGLSLGRSRVDFSERDQLVLDVLRPHLRHAYQTSELVSALVGALEGSGRGVVLLGRSAEVRMATDQAQRWLQAYFGAPAGWRNGLPDVVRAWAQRQRAAWTQEDDIPPPAQPLIAEADGRRLVMQIVRAGGKREYDLVLLEEQHEDPASAFGLTAREVEVLSQAAVGMTDAEIAAVLSVSRRTVHGHLLQIYRKLGVSNRTAAVARAFPRSRD